METVVRVQSEIARYLAQIEEFDPGDDPDLSRLNTEFLNYLVAACSDNTPLLTADILLPSIGDMGVITSADGNLRIYWWDTRLGDIITAYNAIAQYNDGNSVKVEVLNNTSLRDKQNSIINYGGYYQTIHSFSKPDGTVVYLADSIAIVGMPYLPETLQAFIIDTNGLCPAKVFNTNSGPSDKIEIEYDQVDALNRKTIHFGEDGLQLFIPETNNFMFTGNYGVYTFNGHYFEPDGM